MVLGQGQERVLTSRVSSGYRLESGMQNMSIHTKTTSGYSGECPGLGGQGRRAVPVRFPLVQPKKRGPVKCLV